MRLTTQGALLVLATVTVSVVAGAQTKSPAAKKPRVFFIEPKNNATVKSPVQMKFGSEGIEIAAVPKGEVTKTRPGVAHYHVGIDEACLPAGKAIVKGTPSWVHFGDGSNVFESQLTPGKHKLALQLGDDLHVTMPGTCAVIMVNVK
ncbi:MAG: rod shape-determining protein RodA [Acidobacteria bacterium]|nr:MAG: rod shape-determining protein RodA [Acidobacteriota bacterium]